METMEQQIRRRNYLYYKVKDSIVSSIISSVTKYGDEYSDGEIEEIVKDACYTVADNLDEYIFD